MLGWRAVLRAGSERNPSSHSACGRRGGPARLPTAGDGRHRASDRASSPDQMKHLHRGESPLILVSRQAASREPRRSGHKDAVGKLFDPPGSFCRGRTS